MAKSQTEFMQEIERRIDEALSMMAQANIRTITGVSSVLEAAAGAVLSLKGQDDQEVHDAAADAIADELRKVTQMLNRAVERYQVMVND